MATTNRKNIVGMDEVDLDRPIHRIYSLKYLLATLDSGNDVLVRPRRWDDPFENFLLSHGALDDTPHPPIPLSNLADHWYGQCWSLTPESDAMWRIYSPGPRSRGVKARTTIRKLFDNLRHWPSEAPYLQYFIGKVAYHQEDEISGLAASMHFSDLTMGGQGDGFAKLLCIKREAFAHENEVRLLFHEMSDHRRADGDLLSYPLDMNAVFDELILDPRMSELAAKRLRARLKKAGCTLPMSRSTLYQAPSFVIKP